MTQTIRDIEIEAPVEENVIAVNLFDWVWRGVNGSYCEFYTSKFFRDLNTIIIYRPLGVNLFAVLPALCTPTGVGIVGLRNPSEIEMVPTVGRPSMLWDILSKLLRYTTLVSNRVCRFGPLWVHVEGWNSKATLEFAKAYANNREEEIDERN